MPDTIGHPELVRMLLAAAGRIRANHELLSQLDSAVGDGDHGTTMLRVVEAVEATVAGEAGTDPGRLFSALAWAVMSCDGGSAGPLLGSFFMGLGEGAAGKERFDCAGLAGLFEAGITRLQKQSRAGIGDKTMMDAFLPALEALQAAAPAGDIVAAMQQAAAAAARGAEATKAMRAKFGRARNLGDRTIGSADPGAVSISLFFEGFHAALAAAP